MTCGRQFGLLIWKNWLLQKRNKVLTGFEIGLPAVFALILMLIRQRVDSEVVGNVTTWNSVPITDPLPSSLDTEGLITTWGLAYSPNNSVVTRIVERAAQRMDMRTNGYGFATEEEMKAYILSLDLANVDILAGVSFTHESNSPENLPMNIHYKIRPRAEQYGRRSGGRPRFIYASDWYTSAMYPFTSRVGPRQASSADGGTPGYYTEGFLTVQRAIDLAIIEEINSTAAVNDIDMRMKRHPYPKYILDPFVAVLQNQFPFIIMLSFIVIAPNICKDLVLEKERKLKESMKLMGLHSSLHWMAWFLKYFIFLLISVAIMTLFFHLNAGKGAIINYTHPTVTLVFLLLYSIATIMFCFAVSTFFSKASAGAAAGGILYLVTYVPYFFMQFRLDELQVQHKVGASIIPNLAMALGCVEISLHEGAGLGVQWSTLNQPVNTDHNFTMLHVFLLLILDSVIFGLITWYFDAVLPGDYGIPRPFYFPFTRSYWCGQSDHHVDYSDTGALDYSTLPDIDPVYFETNNSATPGIKIRNLRKEFKKNGQTKVAVKNMSIDMNEGQITSLLGHNGAGKTTTMFMLTGFLPPTHGTAIVNGYDINREIDVVRKSLGLCPQHDILFDTLTVHEHLTFFAKLKGCRDDEIEAEVDNMISVLRLQAKRDVFAQNLSGGMKRKLSVGIALIAGSKIVILDEPTSGMDPEARRQTWDILQSHRAGRTMILSTHFMEEADLLGDRIAIMADGVIQCCGSSLFLKSKYGVGYHMVMVKQPGCDANNVGKIIRKYVPNAKLESNISAELSFVLPNENSSQFESLFTYLEDNKDMLKIASFGASVTTMEEVFLRVGESLDDSIENKLQKGLDSNLVHPESSNTHPHYNDYTNKSYLPEVEDTDVRLEKDADAEKEYTVTSFPFSATNGAAKNSSATHVTDERPPRVLSIYDDLPAVFGKDAARCSGWRLALQQFRAMFVKRMIHSWRNLVVTLVQIIVPLIFTILACVVLQTFPGPRDPPPLLLDLSHWNQPITPCLTLESENATLARDFSDEFNHYARRFGLADDVTSMDDMDEYLNEQAEDNFGLYNKAYMTAATFEDLPNNSNYSTLAIGHFNNIAYHVNAIVMNLMGNTLLRHYTGQNYSISATNHPLPRTTETVIQDELTTLIAVGFMVSWCVSFGMAFLVGTFAVFIIKERAVKAKHVQFVSGVHVANYWMSTFLWDLINFLIPTLLLLVVFAGFNLEAYVKDNNAGFVFLIFLFYAWSVLPFVYLLSYIFSVASTGYVWITVLNIFTGTAAILAVVILQYPDLDTEEIGKALEWVFFVILPNFCFGNALQNLFSNHETISICSQLDDIDENLDRETLCRAFGLLGYSVPCCPDNCGTFCAEYQDNYLAWASPGLGRPITFMAIQGIVFFCIIFLIESGVWGNCCQRALAGNKKSDDADAEEIGLDQSYISEDSDVKEENNRIASGDLNRLKKENALLLTEIRKYYGNFMAVDSLSVGIPQGECFGLLGVNGAGKTTTFKMMTGDEAVSAGNAYLGGYSVTSHIKQVQQLLGYCPQFDALIDQMTVTETLWMYARLRGVKEESIKGVVNILLKQLLLREYADKQAGQLSGGNKRKLSAAIALVGDPPVVFLDEPTTGMDPLARRLLWDTLTKVRESGRTLVLTSHSMEECEALCTRLAIMVNGKFRCLGSTQHLKNKFGEGYTLMAKVLSPTDDSVDSIESRTTDLEAFIERTFPGSILKDMHQGLLHYQVPSAGNSWAKVFGTMERAKEQYHIEDYSVSQTTLEQVFINFARAQIPPREEGLSCSVKCSNCCSFFCCCCCR